MADEGRKQLYTLALYTLHEDNTNVSVRDGSNTGTHTSRPGLMR